MAAMSFVELEFKTLSSAYTTFSLLHLQPETLQSNV